MLIIFFITLASTLVISEWIWFIEYETYWSFHLSWISLMAVGKATILGQNSPWFKFACITQEILFGFNATADLLFWIVLAPIVFPEMPNTPSGWFGCCRLVFLHLTPVVSTIVNLTLTDMSFQMSHWKFVFGTAILYIPFNAYGTWLQGAALYPVVDWKNPLETIALFVLQACVMTGFFCLAAHLTKRTKA